MTTGSTRTKALADGRRADSARRRQRVTAAINRAAADGTDISVSAIARAAAVDRTFLYRHRDLLGQVHATQAGPPAGGTGQGVTRASLQADLLAAHERALRLSARIQQLEKRLSETLGDQAWREIRARRTRRHRHPQPHDHPPGTAGHRSAHPARRTRQRTRRRPHRQPRAHGPAQRCTPPVTSQPRTSILP
jgi:hypothetical protein